MTRIDTPGEQLPYTASRRRAARGVTLIVSAVAVLAAACGGSTTAAPPLTLNMRTGPWPTPDNVPDRVTAAGLPHSATEFLTVHYHSHLDVFVNGRPEPVASSIGRVDDSFFSPLHTHATSGLIHIEAVADLRFTLAMLFTEWGVRLNDNCVGVYCRPSTPIRAYVDGKLDSEPMPAIGLVKGREIVLVIGSPPTSIPSGWDCRANIDPTIENPAQCADFGQ